MNILEKINNNMSNFTVGERLVAEYAIQYPVDVVRYSAEALAEHCNTSRSNVVRLCKKLGYTGFSEFKYEMNRYMNTPHAITKKHLNEEEGDSLSAFRKYLNCFSQLETLYNSSQLKQIAEIILRSKRIIILGHYHSFFSAQQLEFRLNRCRIDAHAINDLSTTEAFGEMLTQEDTVIIFSISGGKVYHDSVCTFRKRGVKVILISMTENSPISRYTDIKVILPCITRLYDESVLDDAPTFYFFIELLIEEINHQILAKNDVSDNS
ncbi:MurR/RpiR family transcriptional regulator [Lacrimispora sp.]|jgi:DNA-binding MurR/RpiR family transcriptional regulator|uniref:MurR/RpiR family transcriptional regulator n=1 Tax=Lacrimispora sp. TaxID=2719234 RepID=UPI00289E1E37|nr:MurR/RpiR family transcriptional regulator [Lacrimispora sp.]